MRYKCYFFMNFKLILFALLFSHFACQAQKEDTQTTQPDSSSISSKQTAAVVPDTFDCNLHGMQLEGQTHWMADKQMLFAIAAQGEDVNGALPNYRTFQVYTTNDCNMISYTLMTENPNELPYALQADTYESENEMVCAQGYDFTFCYFVPHREFLLPMAPKFATPRRPSAPAKAPKGLVVKGKTLFGMTAGNGAFAFDLSQRKMPQALMPNVEYVDQQNKTFKQLFLIHDEKGTQAYLPHLKNDKFQLNPLLAGDEFLSPRVIRDRRSGRYALLRTKTDSRALVFDLQESKILNLPEELKETPAILNYLDKR